MKQFFYEITLIPKDYEDFINYLNFIYEEAIEEDDNKIILRSEQKLDDIIELLQKDFEFDYKIEKKENKNWIEIYKQNIKPVLLVMLL